MARCKRFLKVIPLEESRRLVRPGDIFERLTVIGEPFFARIYKPTKWEKADQFAVCECICKNIVIVKCLRLKDTSTKSCGCWLVDVTSERNKRLFTTHGDSRYNNLYRAWRGMIQRTTDKTRKGYHRYGGRGIKLCEEWLEYINFRKWSYDNGYKKGLSLDRLDVDGNYEPSNCEWVTRQENSRRQTAARDAKIIELKNIVSLYEKEILDLKGILYDYDY